MIFTKSGSGLKNHVERGLGRAAKAGESAFGYDIAQASLARLRAERQSHFL